MSICSGLSWTWRASVSVWLRLVDHWVWIYRCIHLKDLAVSSCHCVTDAGISMVIRQCNELHKLSFGGLPQITGMCALYWAPGITLPFIPLWCMYSYSRFIAVHKGPLVNHIVSRYNSAHIFIPFSLVLHSIACCSQIHTIIIHIFKNLGSGPLCFPLSVQYIFCWPSSNNFPMRN
jgi:hypothetical protein